MSAPAEQHDEHDTAQKPRCTVTPLPGIGERRRYSGVTQPFVAHAHDHYVIGLVEEGQRDLVCNGRSFTLSPEDMVLFNPGDVHGCTQEDDGVFAYDSIAVNGSLCDAVRLRGPKLDDPKARELFQSLLASLDQARPDNLQEDLCILLDALAVDEPCDSAPAKHDEAAQHVYARFCGNLSETPSLQTLADTEGLSPYALIRAYRKRFSITPMQHLASLRIECACKLLAEDVEPSCVAAEAGFADQAHLTRVFKQRIGTTPAAYRKMVARTSSMTDQRELPR